ncbi:MAG: LysR family transcriptional regulator [Tropicimonas sp.]|uniref:LysR family transcriptional regulator n=1 Tax=Tropicimonas sp. TaxID=2067044 RepID=UPI003A8A6988
MRVTIAQLEAFVSVARLGTVHEASRHLNLAQPTVSLRLRDLEAAMEVRLFERSGRNLRLSPDGAGLLEDAEAVLRNVSKLKGRANRDEISGPFRLGVAETFAVTALPALLKRVAARHAALRVELVIGPSPDLVRDVVEQRIDMAIAVNPQADARLRIVPLGVQPATWTASPGAQLPPVIRPADVLHHPVLMNPTPYPNWHQTMSWFGTAGLEPLQVSHCNTVPSVIAHLIEAGLGIAILPTRLIEPQLRAGRLIPLDCQPALERSILCTVRIGGEALPAHEALLSATRDVLAELELLEAL